MLIHAASGGVGHLAVQCAKALGAHVVATASGSNREYVNSLGDDEFVDYREQRFETSVAPVHAVIDTVGGTVQQRSLDVLKREGFSSPCQRRSRTRSRPKPSDAVYGCDTSASNRTLTR